MDTTTGQPLSNDDARCSSSAADCDAGQQRVGLTAALPSLDVGEQVEQCDSAADCEAEQRYMDIAMKQPLLSDDAQRCMALGYATVAVGNPGITTAKDGDLVEPYITGRPVATDLPSVSVVSTAAIDTACKTTIADCGGASTDAADVAVTVTTVGIMITVAAVIAVPGDVGQRQQQQWAMQQHGFMAADPLTDLDTIPFITPAARSKVTVAISLPVIAATEDGDTVELSISAGPVATDLTSDNAAPTAAIEDACKAIIADYGGASFDATDVAVTLTAVGNTIVADVVICGMPLCVRNQAMGIARAINY